MVTFGNSNVKTTGAPDLKDEMEENKFHSYPHYGSISGDTCPTCRGTGRIPRGHDQLVAVISCNDQRLKPRHTKRYVCISLVVCLFVSCLILFFLFPRSVTITPVSVQSVMVYFTPDNSQLTMEVKNLINISNQNYVPVQIVEFDVQGLISHTVRGRNKICNMTAMQSRSQKMHTFQIDLTILEEDLNSFCRSSSIKIHMLFLELQMTMNITYLSHSEQVSVNTFEYIDCGANSTIPHPMA